MASIAGHGSEVPLYRILRDPPDGEEAVPYAKRREYRARVGGGA